MKTYHSFALLVLLLALFANPVFAQESSKTGPVHAIWDIYLKEDADHAAFEKLYLNEVIPLEERCMPGLKVLLIKGDRGRDDGAYKYIWMFESVSDRNAYWPTEGGGENETKGLGSIANELCKEDYDAVSEKLMGFYDLEKYQSLTSPPYTDFVVLEKVN